MSWRRGVVERGDRPSRLRPRPLPVSRPAARRRRGRQRWLPVWWAGRRRRRPFGWPDRRLSVRADFRLILWKLDYPIQYKVPPPDAPGNPAVLPLTASLSDWTTHAWWTIGLGWNF